MTPRLPAMSTGLSGNHPKITPLEIEDPKMRHGRALARRRALAAWLADLLGRAVLEALPSVLAERVV